MHLYADLYAADGQLLVRKGETITPAVIRRIRRLGRAVPQKRIPLKRTFLCRDFKKALRDPRYATLFNPPVPRDAMARLAGRLRVEKGLLTELAYMKRRLPYTYGHVLVVAACAIKVALSFPAREFDRLLVVHCGFTHDLGKTRIPVTILQKKGALTHNERAVIETHPIAGYLLLNYYLKSDLQDCSLASLGHHERSDGSGYPSGIKRIRKYARLMSAIDVLDALMTKRPYRSCPFSLRASLDYLLKQSDAGKLDPKIVRILIRYARRERPSLARMRISRKLREPLPEELSHEKYR